MTEQTHVSVSRKRGESIVVEGPATIEIRKTSRYRVQLIVHAPPETRVYRVTSLDKRAKKM